MMRLARRIIAQLLAFSIRLRRRLRRRAWPGPSVWKSWEQSTRTAGLAAIGLSVFASGRVVNPWSLLAGVVLLVLNVYIAGELDRMETKGD